MSEPINQRCRSRAEWYVEHIDALHLSIAGYARMDGDEVERCQAMLRELIARFRADRRTPANGQLVSAPEQAYHTAINEAGNLLRISASSRPTVRWRDELAACRRCLVSYLDQLAESRPN